MKMKKLLEGWSTGDSDSEVSTRPKGGEKNCKRVLSSFTVLISAHSLRVMGVLAIGPNEWNLHHGGRYG